MIGIAIIAGIVAGGFALTRMVANPDEAAYRVGGRVAIVLVPSEGAVGKAVDKMSGSYGFSHVGIDTLERSGEGEHLGIDCHVGIGVTRRKIHEISGGRRTVKIYLPYEAGECMYRAARTRIGKPYGIDGLVSDRRFESSSYQCAQFVYECMTPHLQGQVEHYRVVSPNDLARAFGVTPLSESVVL